MTSPLKDYCRNSCFSSDYFEVGSYSEDYYSNICVFVYSDSCYKAGFFCKVVPDNFFEYPFDWD